MNESSEPDGLARELGEKLGVAPQPGFPVEADDLTLPIVGRTLSVVAFGVGSYYLRLHFWGPPDFVIEIEGPSVIRRTKDAQPTQIEPGSGPYNAVLAVLGGTVEMAIANQDGALRLGFTDGTVFEVVAPDGFEIWQLRDEDDDDHLLVTNAGGGLVEFGGQPRSDG